MPLENIGSMEVVKSAGSVLYGSSALNGVVNMRTADPVSKPSASVSVFTGFYGNPARDSLKWDNRNRTASGLNGFYSVKKGNTGIVIAGNILADEGYRKREVNYRGRVTVKLSHQSKKIAGLKYGINLSGQRGFSGSFLLWRNFAQGYLPLDSGYTYTNTSRASFDPYISISQGKTTHKLLSRVYLLENVVDNGKANNNQNNGSSLVYNEYKFSRSFAEKSLMVNAGLVSMFAETHSPLFSGHQTSQNQAAYLQLEYRIGKLIATAGGRYEYFKLNAFAQRKPVFRGGLNYAPGRFTNLRASWGQGFRFPSMAEAFTTTTVGALTIFPNPQLKPETGSSMEFGIKQGYRIGNFRAYADLSVYQMDMNNMMEFTFAQWGDIMGPLIGLGFKSINVAKCRINGYEIETAGEGKIGAFTFHVLAGYTYSNPVCLDENKVIAIDTSKRKLTYANTRADNNSFLKYRYKHLWRGDVQARYKNFELGVSTRYNSAMLNIDKAFVEQPFDLIVPEIDRARKALKTTFVIDLRIAHYFGENFKLTFQALNLLNSQYMARPCDLRPPRSFQMQMVWKL
jgi:iron complex outermembrane receptor protein